LRQQGNETASCHLLLEKSPSRYDRVKENL
jgi:hypothetical protein